MDPALWKRVAVRAAERGTTRTDALEQGLRWWLGSDPAQIHGVESDTTKPKPFSESKFPGVHDMLERILQSGNKKAISAVKQNLDTFDDYIRIAGGFGKESSSTPAADPKTGKDDRDERKASGGGKSPRG